MSLLNQLEELEKAIGYAEFHLDKAGESPTERQAELSDWLDDAYVRREKLMDMFKPPTAKELEKPEKPSVFSRVFKSIKEWKQKPHSVAYTKRIESFARRYPGRPLKEARGHG